MKRFAILAALLAFAMASGASAQLTLSGGTGGPTTNQRPDANRKFGGSQYLKSQRNITSLFGSFKLFTNDHNIPQMSSSIPNPNSSAYLQSFGFRRGF
jgi:hypothetical protein